VLDECAPVVEDVNTVQGNIRADSGGFGSHESQHEYDPPDEPGRSVSSGHNYLLTPA
jgi:hypothetical protein